ncbi:isoprenoid synthase domain-containing protein [Penicillium capsulatum]|nr:isoprenoid synthase domain-containing protein [Penicillium capsulatum]
MSVREILNNVKGHQIRVPCLFSLSPSWQARLNPEYDHSVEESLEAWRQKSWLSDPACYERNAGADCAFFTRTVNPEATKASMKTVAKLSSWVFAWDDVLDFGTLDLSPKDRKVFYDETVSVIKESILNDPMKPQPFEAIAPTFKVAQSFYEIGELIHAGSQHSAIKMEDAFQEDIIQGLDEYISNRMGSSCVYGIIAISL